jgi:hypothetical protein
MGSISYKTIASVHAIPVNIKHENTKLSKPPYLEKRDHTTHNAGIHSVTCQHSHRHTYIHYKNRARRNDKSR